MKDLLALRFIEVRGIEATKEVYRAEDTDRRAS
jgi:hypothetical protein